MIMLFKKLIKKFKLAKRYALIERRAIYRELLFLIVLTILLFYKIIRRYKLDKKLFLLLPNIKTFAGKMYLGRIFGIKEFGLHMIDEKQTTLYMKKLSGNVFIDVGAFVGYYTLLLANNFKFVLAIEPNPLALKVIKYNIRKRKLKNVYALNIALSEKEGIREFFINLDNPTESSFQLNWMKDIVKSVKVTTKRLDTIIREFNFKFQDVNLIKIDVEGAEMLILEGSKNLLQEGSPILIIEIFDKYKDVVRKLVSRFNYKVVKALDVRYNPTKRERYANYVFIKDTNK